MGDPIPSSSITDATLGGISLIVVSGGSDGDVLTQQSDGTYAPESPAAAGIVGSVGSVTDRLVKSSGTGGSTVQATGITVDASDNLTCYGNVNIGTAGGANTRLQLNQWGQVFVPYPGVFVLRDHAADPATYPARICLSGSTSSFPSVGRSGTTVTIRLADDSADTDLTCRAVTLSGGSNLAPITRAALLLLTPTAATGGRWRVTDATPANREAYPDGTVWRYSSDDSVVT